MKHLLLILIKSYWLLIPPRKRNRCLFNKSCSQYVFKTTQEQGFFKGLKALRFRWKHCRPGYYIVSVNSEKILISANHESFCNTDIKPTIFTNYPSHEIV